MKNNFMRLGKKLIYPSKLIQRAILNEKRSLQKEVLNSLSDLLVNDPIIKVNEFSGVFAIDASSDLFSRIVTYKRYEPEMVGYCKKYLDENRDAIDIGANIGFFTIMFAKGLKKGKVLAIEPTQNAIRRLYKNIGLNNAEGKVIVFEGVALNKPGLVQIKTIDGKEEYSSLGVMKHPAIVEEEYSLEDVTSKTVDELVADNRLDPGFIKIDVEGVEHLVFEGMKNVLRINRPVILSELSNLLLKSNGSSSAKVIKMLEMFDYDIFDPLDFAMKPGTNSFGNIICFPSEMNVK